jgi:hypothetical protein
MSKNTKTPNATVLATAAQKLVLSPYAKNLLAVAVDKCIEFALDPPAGAFENKNASRDTWFANQLEANKRDVKAAAAAIVGAMRSRKLATVTILTALDAFFYNILKQALFPAFADSNQLLSVLAGKLPDSFFESMNGESFEDQDDEDARRRAGFPIDTREETATAPPGCEENYVTLYSGFEVQIGATEDATPDGLNTLACLAGEREFGTKDIGEGLDDVRIYLETIRTSYGKMPERMAFYVEQVGGQWVRHNGNVHAVMASYALKMGEKNKARDAAQRSFYETENAKIAAAA